MSSRRKERINELIRREISKKLIAEVKDPRIGFVTVTRADVHDDMTGVDIYVTVFDEDKPVEETIKVLNKMSGFLQRDLGVILRTRITPKVKFKRDYGSESSFGLDSLIKKARDSDPDNLYPKDETGELENPESSPEQNEP